MSGRPALACGHWERSGLLLPVRVQPRARRLALGAIAAGRLRLTLTAPPVDGKANAQACELLAESFGVSPSRVRLMQGEKGRNKLFLIEDPQRIPAEVLAG